MKKFSAPPPPPEKILPPPPPPPEKDESSEVALMAATTALGEVVKSSEGVALSLAKSIAALAKQQGPRTVRVRIIRDEYTREMTELLISSTKE